MGKNKEWKWGYISHDGRMAIPPSYDGASDFSEGLAAVKIDWARGYINRKGDFIVKPIFESAGNFKDGLAVVRLEGKSCYVDSNGEILDNKIITVPDNQNIEFESGFNPRYEFHEGLIRFVENQKYGYKNEEGEIIIKPQYFEANDFSEGLACVKKGKNSSWCYIDTSGKVVITGDFKQAKSFHEGLAAVLTVVE